MALDLNALTTREAVTAIFIGYYDRAPAPNGLNYWVNDIDNNGFTLADVARAFAVQQESQDIYPGLTTAGSGDLAADVAFVTAIFNNLFGRDPNNITENGGADNVWVAALQGGADVGQLILDIMSGAQGNDKAILENKIAVGLDYATSAEAVGALTREALGDSILDDVDATPGSVDAAKAIIDSAFVVVVPGETRSFTSSTDNLTGTNGDDTFEGYLAQNQFAGGVSNSLSSADRADGGAGNDSLYAEMVSEFVGATSGTAEQIDTQPRITNIETLEFEARDIASNAPFNFDIQDLVASLGYSFGAGGPFGAGGIINEENIAKVLDGWQRDIVIDAKNITGHDFIGSTFSDGDLMIENLTTIDSNGAVRNTGDITITMDHTDNANSDGDASDLVVYFDEDYLIAGQDTTSIVRYYLLDEQAELAGDPNRLKDINVDGILFSLDGGVTVIEISDPAALTAGTHQGFVDALQPALNQAIADGKVPAGTTITLGTAPTDTTGLDDGSLSGPIPPIELTIGDGSEVTDGGFAQVPDLLGDYDVYGQFEPNPPTTEDLPVSVNIDLHKAGRGGEGGNLVIGGKDQTEAGDGIEVFHINVKGDGPSAVVDQPSNLGTITSTNNALREVYIKTDLADVGKDSVASLTVRDGFNEIYDGDSSLGAESGDLQKIDANLFRGDLTLGGNALGAVPAGLFPAPGFGVPPLPGIQLPFLAEGESIINADMVTAMGGGNVTFWGEYTGTEDNQKYSIMTSGGNDTFVLDIDGDAIDAVTEGLSLNMGDGNNTAFLHAGGSSLNGAITSDQFDADNVSQPTTDLLKNLDVTGGSGMDMVTVGPSIAGLTAPAGPFGNIGNGHWMIDTNAGSDTVFINNGGARGAGDFWRPSESGLTTGAGGSDAFPDTVLYKAELVISVGGFESTVQIDTGDDFILTEAEFNANALRAIEQNPIIKQLLVAEVGTTDQNLLARALVDGTTQSGYQIRQPELVVSTGTLTAGSSQVLLAASDVAGMQRDLVKVGNAPGDPINSIPDSAAVPDAATIVGLYADVALAGDGMFGNTTAADGYLGQIFTALATPDGGSNGGLINNSDINIGVGAEDLVILGSNSGAPTPGTVSTGPGDPGTPWAAGAGGSSNTLIFDDANAGKVSIVNWFDDTSTILTSSFAGTVGAAASHLLDFTHFLTNMSTTSGSSASATREAIDVKGNIVLQANSIHFVTIDELEDLADAPTGGYTAKLTAAQLKTLIEADDFAGDGGGTTGITYGDATVIGVSGVTTNGLVSGTTQRTSIIAVENVDIEVEAPTDAIPDPTQIDNTNRGEYTFYQVVYGIAEETSSATVEVTEIKTLDFGNSIAPSVTAPGAEGALEANIVGTLATDITLNDIVS